MPRTSYATCCSLLRVARAARPSITAGGPKYFQSRALLGDDQQKTAFFSLASRRAARGERLGGATHVRRAGPVCTGRAPSPKSGQRALAIPFAVRLYEQLTSLVSASLSSFAPRFESRIRSSPFSSDQFRVFGRARKSFTRKTAPCPASSARILPRAPTRRC